MVPSVVDPAEVALVGLEGGEQRIAAAVVEAYCWLPPPLKSMSMRKWLAADQAAAVATSFGASRSASAGL